MSALVLGVTALMLAVGLDRVRQEEPLHREADDEARGADPVRIRDD